MDHMVVWAHAATIGGKSLFCGCNSTVLEIPLENHRLKTPKTLVLRSSEYGVRKVQFPNT
jgi:hypothetical protein